MSEEINILYVHYGKDEYTSHITNEAMARQYANTHREHWPLLVNTVEHGGWAMVHYFDGNNPNGICVGTANDAAQWWPAQRDIRERIYNLRRNMIGDIRRPRRTVAA